MFSLVVSHVFSLESASLDKSMADLNVNIPAVVSCSHTDMTSDAFTKMHACGACLFLNDFLSGQNPVFSFDLFKCLVNSKWSSSHLVTFAGYGALGVKDSSGKLVSYLGATHLKVC